MNATSALLGPPEVNEEPDFLYEVVNGQIVELPPMGAFQTLLASELARHLGNFAEKHGLARVVVEMLFLLDRAKDLQRRPDVAVVTYGRWPADREVPSTSAWEVVPDLAAEIISPTNSADAVLAKVQEYFESGVKRVWVVYPTQKQVYVYRSLVDPKVLTAADELDGEDILPGFRLPVAVLFGLRQ